jgi:hypothetical protein
MATRKRMVKKQTKGGAREGAGRRSLYGEALEKKVPMSINQVQGNALVEYCGRKRISVSMLVREAALKHSGAPEALRLGFQKAYGSLGAHDYVGLDMSDAEKAFRFLPVKYTTPQWEWLSKHCGAKGVKLATFEKEATFKEMKQPKLGLAGALDQVKDAVN